MKLTICCRDQAYSGRASRRRALFFLAAAIFACAPAAAEAQPGGSDVTVPDLETKIRNTGSSVPEQALPELKAPAPAPIPELGDRAVVPEQNAVPGASAEPATKPSETAVPPAAENAGTNASSMSGSASISAGLPGAVSAAFSFARKAPDFPSASVSFYHDAADGYSGEAAGSGYFDRETKIAVGVSGDSESASGAVWFADASFAERAYGFQGQSSRYFDLARRDASWSIGARFIPLGKSPIALALSGGGSVYSSFTEGEGSLSAPHATAALADSTGYLLSPRAALSFERGNFSAELSGRYGYETAADLDELHDGEGSLALRFSAAGFDLSASAGIAGDSGDGAVVPFSVSVAWESDKAVETGADGNARPASSASIAGISLREAHLSGGIDRKRVSFYSLSAAEPLAEYRGLSVYAADWNANAGLTVAPAGKANAVSPLSFGAGAEYRRSLAGHGTLVAADSLDSSALVAVRRTGRSSLVTNAAARWDGDGFAAKTGWSLEWLDRLDRESVHSLTCGLEAFDRASEKKWKAGVDASFALDRAEAPDLSASGTVYPVKNLSVDLSLEDAISLATGKARERNGLYLERSGTLKLSAGIYF